METKAIKFATLHHGNQKRKYTGEPYVKHLEGVVSLVKSVPTHTEAMVLAAWLHDTMEDTAVTHYMLVEEFGEEVANLVDMVTDVSQPEDGNRKARKSKDIAHLATASAEGKTIKLADLINNTHDIVSHDKEFAKIYLAEKKATLEVLKAGDAYLYRVASKIVSDGLKLLGIEV